MYVIPSAPSDLKFLKGKLKAVIGYSHSMDNHNFAPRLVPEDSSPFSQ
jgi:hypothetical protein